MKIVIKSLKGTRLEIEVDPEDSVADVKKKIETLLGASSYPAEEQKLIHRGKVLKDETTMATNKVAEKSSIAVMKAQPAAPSTQPLITRATQSSLTTSRRCATAIESLPLSILTPLPPSATASNLVAESISDSESRIQQNSAVSEFRE